MSVCNIVTLYDALSVTQGNAFVAPVNPVVAPVPGAQLVVPDVSAVASPAVEAAANHSTV